MLQETVSGLYIGLQKNHAFGPDMLFGWRESKWSKITDLHTKKNLMRKKLLELPAWDQKPDIQQLDHCVFLVIHD